VNAAALARMVACACACVCGDDVCGRYAPKWRLKTVNAVLQMDNRLQRDYHGVVCVFY